LDPASEALQNAALQLAAARDAASTATAVREAQGVVAASMKAHLAGPSTAKITRDPLSGRLVQELTPGAVPR
jgi:hypothetical protein